MHPRPPPLQTTSAACCTCVWCAVSLPHGVGLGYSKQSSLFREGRAQLIPRRLVQTFSLQSVGSGTSLRWSSCDTFYTPQKRPFYQVTAGAQIALCVICGSSNFAACTRLHVASCRSRICFTDSGILRFAQHRLVPVEKTCASFSRPSEYNAFAIFGSAFDGRLVEL